MSPLPWLKFVALAIATLKQSNAGDEDSSKKMIFLRARNYGGALIPEDVISSHRVHSQIQCSLKCLEKQTCIGFNYRDERAGDENAFNCVISNTTQHEEVEKDRNENWTFYRAFETLLLGNKEDDASEKNSDITLEGSLRHLENITSCLELYEKTPNSPNGAYKFKDTVQAYCDISNGGWTLIARFSNNDSDHWISNSFFWYDRVTPFGNTSSSSENTDMIAKAFWDIEGSELKITRSNDSNHTALLQTTSNCLLGKTFRSKISGYGNFRNTVWATDKCHGNCRVKYGGQYKTTAAFEQHSCSSDIQSSNYVGFWCDWSHGDGAVMMIGGGGSSCERADHGIGITEENDAAFGGSEPRNDFGTDSSAPSANAYSLNLWVR